MQDNNSTDHLKHGIVLVFIANFINLAISLVNGFVLPKYLPVDSYADIKTYQLYATYVGVLVLGYADGIYLKYGGKSISSISNKEINTFRTNMIAFQGIMTILFVFIGFIINDIILAIAALTLVPANLIQAFKNLLQATGEFKTYSKLLNYMSIMNFVGSMILLIVFKVQEAYYYVGVMVVVNFIVWFILEFKLKKAYNYKFGFNLSFSDLKENIKSGIVLMLGNFSSILMTSIDRWFVKFLLTTSDFAYYSFVVSTESLITLFINPIVTTMYNYICKLKDYSSLVRIKKMCLIISVFLVSVAFPIKFILEVYLKKYYPSVNVLFILFSTEILFMLIKGIYVNVYKARKQQNLYFKQLVISIIIGCIFNAVFYFIFHSIEGIALATLISVTIWYVMCCISVKEIRPDWKEIVILCVSIVLFILCGMTFWSVIGFAIYVSVMVFLCTVLMKKEFLGIFSLVKSMVQKRIHRKKPSSDNE